MANPKSVGKAQPKVAGPASVSTSGLVTCPFTGKMIQFKTVGPDAHVMGIGPFYTTKLFETKQDCINALMTRDGNQPPWAKKTVSKVTVADTDDDTEQEIAALTKRQHEAASIK